MAKAKFICWIAVLGKNERVLTERVRCTLTHDTGRWFINKKRITLWTTEKRARATGFGLYFSEDAEFPAIVGQLWVPVRLNIIDSLGVDRAEFAPGALEIHVN